MRVEHSIEEVEALGGYSLLYLDPSWKYRNGGRGAAENHYETSPDGALAELPISRLAAKDAVMFCWGTWPTLETNLATIRSWNFGYKTLGFLWVKHYSPKNAEPFWGGGFWTRSNSEFCLLAVRGDLRRLDTNAARKVHQLIETWDDQDDLVLRAPVAGHSAKPPQVRDRIVQLMGDLPRIELFARDRVAGWDAWGNDPALGGSDIKVILNNVKGG
jgi:site-specific DNA-methyltransferase (adenine-specific)